MKGRWKLIHQPKKGKRRLVETFEKRTDAKKELDMRKGLVYALEKSEAEDIYIIQRS